ncbi:DNA-binding protein [Shewanella vesiculosa]|jgi:excisionase family DNA binding protein|uniref:helix-turn-helix domain-containing protein n=1 Tax=Shewanella vesiculosa TaxID=518738 RepID=UPI000F504B40|nr:helix-turn-helix domain-containing protein [Shewanella vesiculosa]RPA50729.1 DNA-binding protein [Shewanella vesiculosa]UJL44278.1 helix-turn-helix domain-containing protein [Shewanella vesiculosa]
MNTLLTPAEVARYLGVTIGTLSVWRCTGRYPLNFIKVGRRVMYRQSDVENFVNGRVYEHTV